MTPWEIKGREFGNCNCAYGCPCQFNALPTHGHCRGLAVFDIERGHYGDTRLDGLRAVGVFRWPGPIHEGKGEGFHIIDVRASPEQRAGLTRILHGEDSEPGATVFNIFASTCETLHDPIFAAIDLDLDIEGRLARAVVSNHVDMRGAPIVNPVTGAEHRVRIEQPDGFEFAVAEVGRGWTRVQGPVAYELDDTYGQFAHIHLCNTGMVRAA